MLNTASPFTYCCNYANLSTTFYKKYYNLRIYNPELPDRLTIKKTSFDLFTKKNAIEFANNNNFDEYIIKIK